MNNRIVLLLGAAIAVCLTACTDKQKIEAVESQILTEKISKDRYGEYYKVGDYKITQSESSSYITAVMVEQDVTVVKDCHTRNYDPVFSLRICGEDTKAVVKAGTKLKLTYQLLFGKNQDGSYYPKQFGMKSPREVSVSGYEL